MTEINTKEFSVQYQELMIYKILDIAVFVV